MQLAAVGFKFVAEGEIVPGRHGDYACFARRISQAECLTDRLSREGERTHTRRIHDGRRSSQIEAGIL